MSGSTATVFGASGFLARYVVSKFGRTGTQVVVPHRGEEYDVRHCKVMGDLGQVTPMKLDQRSEDSIARALARSNIVVNCIGSWVPTFHNTLSETHAEASERIAKVAKRMGVKQFVHISALSASPNATDAWSKSKWEGEVAVRKVFPEAVILRPGTMCGPEDKFLNRLADRMRSYPVMPEWGFGEAKVQPVSVYDVAEAINVVANKGSAYHGRVFDLAGPKVYTMSDILSFIETTCGMHANRVPVPASVGLMIGSLIESAPYASLYESEVALQTQDVTVGASSNETFEALGIQPESIERLAPEYLRRFREGSHYKQFDQVDPSSKGGHIDI